MITLLLHMTSSFYTHENDNSKLRALHDSYGYKKAPSSVTEGDSLKMSIAFRNILYIDLRYCPKVF